MAKRNSHYITDRELYYQLVVSIGKGENTPELCKMLIKITNNVMLKFRFNMFEDKKDIRQEALYTVLTRVRGFDHNKYDKALPYVTEIIKRAIVLGIQKMGHRYYDGQTKKYANVDLVSMTEITSL